MGPLVELEFGAGCGCAPEWTIAVLVFVPLVGDSPEFGNEPDADDALGLEGDRDGGGGEFEREQFDPFALGDRAGGRFDGAARGVVVERGAVEGAQADGRGHVGKVHLDSRVNGGMVDSKERTMAPGETTREIPRARGRVRWAAMFVGAGIAAAVVLRVQQESAIAFAAKMNEAEAGAVEVKVARHLRASELVTSRIETTVRAQNTDDNWLGSVVATVEAPARLSYGVDLSKLESSRVLFSPIGNVYAVRVPVPARIATEVFTGQEKVSVDLIGLRFRALAGEEQLGIARTRLHEQALKVRVTGVELERVRENARAEVESLVRKIAGESASVRVSFDDESGWRTSMAAGK